MVTVNFVLFPVNRSMLSLFSFQVTRAPKLMQAALPLPVLGGLCFCCTVENWFLLIATVARLHQHSELVRVRSTAWEREEYLKATEESSHEKVSWLLPNDHVTLMADQCLTCKEKVCISARNIHLTENSTATFICCLFGITDRQNVHKNLPM